MRSIGTFSGAGPFTLLAPTNAASAKLTAAAVGSLLDRRTKVMLQSVMSFHVVPERLDVAGRVPRVGTVDERQWAADSDQLAAGTDQDFIAWST